MAWLYVSGYKIPAQDKLHKHVGSFKEALIVHPRPTLDQVSFYNARPIVK